MSAFFATPAPPSCSRVGSSATTRPPRAHTSSDEMWSISASTVATSWSIGYGYGCAASSRRRSAAMRRQLALVVLVLVERADRVRPFAVPVRVE